jgi:hypothetical protein
MVVDKLRTGLLALFLLTGCAQGEKAAVGPPRPNAPEFAKCDWREVKGARLSIWSFACGPKDGDQHLEADDNLPGFYLVSGGKRRLAVQAFGKPPAAPIEAALPSIRSASPGYATASCVLVPATGEDGKGKYWLEPAGRFKTAWDEIEKKGGPADPPCGPLGVAFDRAPYFWVLADHPETVIAADMGSEIQIFHPETLTKPTGS